jgi:hypothetical protein
VPLPQNIAIVSLANEVSMRSLLQATAAVQKQVTRDFEPIWGTPGNVDAFADFNDVPSDYLPVALFRDVRQFAAQMVELVGRDPATRVISAFERGRLTGIHLNSFTRQPFALVAATGAWTVTLSHEILEMLADPSGNRLVAAYHPNPAQRGRRVQYLLEVCDPCLSRWYSVNGVPVSDFVTPQYFDPVRVPGMRYSFTGSLVEPRHILEGGYVTFLDPLDSIVYQVHADNPEPVRLLELPELATSSAPLRTLVDGHPSTPQISLETLRPASTVFAGESPLEAVSEAAAGTALTTAQALYTLLAER